MIVEVDVTTIPAGLRLLDPDDFAHFEVRLIRGEHAWVSPGTLLGMSGEAPDSTWAGRLDDMVAYAGQHGWVDPHGNIRGHVAEDGDAGTEHA